MRVSIVIPAFNGEKWIRKAVESALSQKLYHPGDGLPELYEVIVRDDGSTDETLKALEGIDDKRLRIVKGEKTPGIAESFQAAFELAKSTYVTILGQDDTIDPNYLARVLAEFKGDIAMVGCHPRFIDSDGNPYTNQYDNRLTIPKPGNGTRAQWLEQFNIGNLYFGINTYRRSAVVDVGGFDPKAGWLLDWDLYSRLVKHYDIHVIQEELCSLGLRDDTTSCITLSKIPTQHKYYRYVREKNFKPTKMKLMIATPFYMSQEYSHYGESLLYTCRMLTEAGVPWDLLRVNGDSYVDRAKNTLVANFLESDGTDLLMIDSDMQWHPLAVSRLLQHPEEIVGGAYPFKNNWGQFAGNPLIINNQYAGYRELPDGSCLLQAYNLAGGFLRIKRTALEKFADYYPDLVYTDDYAWPGRPGRIYTEFFKCETINCQRYGEDAAFSRRCKEAGMKLYIDPNLHFTHYGIKGWSGNYHEHLLRPPEEVAKIKEENKVMEETAKLVQAA